jgi:hypothetical protein
MSNMAGEKTIAEVKKEVELLTSKCDELSTAFFEWISEFHKLGGEPSLSMEEWKEAGKIYFEALKVQDSIDDICGEIKEFAKKLSP